VGTAWLLRALSRRSRTALRSRLGMLKSSLDDSMMRGCVRARDTSEEKKLEIDIIGGEEGREEGGDKRDFCVKICRLIRAWAWRGGRAAGLKRELPRTGVESRPPNCVANNWWGLLNNRIV
jgi:hypothetical protein